MVSTFTNIAMAISPIIDSIIAEMKICRVTQHTNTLMTKQNYLQLYLLKLQFNYNKNVLHVRNKVYNTSVHQIITFCCMPLLKAIRIKLNTKGNFTF